MNEVPVTPLLEAKNIKKYFKLKDGRELHAVDNVSFSVYPGKTLGLVGESGCGKEPLATLLCGYWNLLQVSCFSAVKMFFY